MKHKLMLATAESCTGGGIGEAVTMVPGSSAWFERGFITYTNTAKREMLGVKTGTLDTDGAVSEQTATVDSVRLAVLAALNIADEYHLLKRRLATTPPEVRQRTSKLESALDEVLQDGRRTG